MPTNGFIPQSNDGQSANTNTRIRTRFATPGQREHVTLPSSNHDRSDHNNAKQLPVEETAVVCVSKPTTEFLQRKRATTANGLQKNANDSVDQVLESVVDEDENRNFRVRDWLSSLDSTLCQRYARRQMASLREYELTNQKTWWKVKLYNKLASIGALCFDKMSCPIRKADRKRVFNEQH